MGAVDLVEQHDRARPLREPDHERVRLAAGEQAQGVAGRDELGAVEAHRPCVGSAEHGRQGARQARLADAGRPGEHVGARPARRGQPVHPGDEVVDHRRACLGLAQHRLLEHRQHRLGGGDEVPADPAALQTEMPRTGCAERGGRGAAAGLRERPAQEAQHRAELHLGGVVTHRQSEGLREGLVGRPATHAAARQLLGGDGPRLRGAGRRRFDHRELCRELGLSFAKLRPSVRASRSRPCAPGGGWRRRPACPPGRWPPRGPARRRWPCARPRTG